MNTFTGSSEFTGSSQETHMPGWEPERYDPQLHRQRMRGQQQYNPYTQQGWPQQYPPQDYGQPPYPPPQPPRRPWVARHKVLTGFLALSGLVLIIGIAAAASSPSS